MSRWKWSPLRHVAENVSAGDRRYWNLLKIPELGYGKASEAISEMERIGVLAVTSDFVEPTAAFSSWIVELRRREDLGVAVQPAGQSPVVPQTAPEDNVPVSVGTVKRKRYFKRLNRYPREAALEMAARIKEKIEATGRRTMTLSALKRSLHAHRHPEAWKEAIGRLVVHRIAKVADGNITLKWSEFELPDPYGRPKPKRRKRNRGQSDWFRENREKMDAGQHSDFEEDWEDENKDGEDDLTAEKAWWRQLDEKDQEG